MELKFNSKNSHYVVGKEGMLNFWKCGDSEGHFPAMVVGAWGSRAVAGGVSE